MKKSKTRSDSARAKASRDARMAQGWELVQSMLPPEDVQELDLIGPNRTMAVRKLIAKNRLRRLKNVST